VKCRSVGSQYRGVPFFLHGNAPATKQRGLGQRIKRWRYVRWRGYGHCLNWSFTMRSSTFHLRALLTAHPHSVGETYREHARFALRAGLLLTGAGLAALVHAVLPFAFVRHASGVVRRLHAEISQRAGQRGSGAGR
jgi:hypothetical protein